jgi:hypothetical protein
MDFPRGPLGKTFPAHNTQRCLALNWGIVYQMLKCAAGGKQTNACIGIRGIRYVSRNTYVPSMALTDGIQSPKAVTGDIWHATHCKEHPSSAHHFFQDNSKNGQHVRWKDDQGMAYKPPIVCQFFTAYYNEQILT